MINLPGLITNSFTVSFILGTIFVIIKILSGINKEDCDTIPDIIALVLLLAFIFTIF